MMKIVYSAHLILPLIAGGPTGNPAWLSILKACGRLLDNIFQSQRGGVIQRYGVDPFSQFNLLYTFGRHTMQSGENYLPHHAILAEINRANHSIKISLFLIGELLGNYNDSVI